MTLEYEAGNVFKGFMIQARGDGPGEGSNSSDAEQQIVGTFLQHSSYNTLHCSRADVSPDIKKSFVGASDTKKLCNFFSKGYSHPYGQWGQALCHSNVDSSR